MFQIRSMYRAISSSTSTKSCAYIHGLMEYYCPTQMQVSAPTARMCNWDLGSWDGVIRAPNLINGVKLRGFQPFIVVFRRITHARARLSDMVLRPTLRMSRVSPSTANFGRMEKSRKLRWKRAEGSVVGPGQIKKLQQATRRAGRSTIGPTLQPGKV